MEARHSKNRFCRFFFSISTLELFGPLNEWFHWLFFWSRIKKLLPSKRGNVYKGSPCNYEVWWNQLCINMSPFRWAHTLRKTFILSFGSVAISGVINSGEMCSICHVRFTFLRHQSASWLAKRWYLYHVCPLRRKENQEVKSVAIKMLKIVAFVLAWIARKENTMAKVMIWGLLHQG